ELREFRHGAFTLAARHRVPIVPIVVDGTLDVLPKHGLTLHESADITIDVLDPVDPADFADADALRDHVHAVMAAALHAPRTPPPRPAKPGGSGPRRRAAGGAHVGRRRRVIRVLDRVAPVARARPVAHRRAQSPSGASAAPRLAPSSVRS